MAKWSFWTFVATCIGIVILCATFWETAKAAIAAGAAARSADDSVQIMERSAEVDLRAYVALGNPKLSDIDTGKQPAVEFVANNSGRTPARDVSLAIAFVLADKFDSASAPRPMVPPGASNAFISPGSRVPSRIGLTGLILSPDVIQQIKDGGKSVFIYGTLTYSDPFKKGRETHFRLVYDHRNIAKNDPGLHFCDAGNSAS
jgi:hypothetical protein